MDRRFKNTAVVNAFQNGRDPFPEWFTNVVRAGYAIVTPDTNDILLVVGNGFVTVRLGDYVCQGTAGEIYARSKEVFERNYEEISGA